MLTGIRADRLCAFLSVLLVAGCASEGEIREAIADVNKHFQTEYEAILAQKGTRTYRVKSGEAFVALRAALGRLGMQIVDQDIDLGTLSVESPAPKPLNEEEWKRAADADLPKMREIARKHIGFIASQWISFEPEGLMVAVKATALDSMTGAGTEIKLTMRLREFAPPASGRPRREYPPPTGLHIGLDKIWAGLEQELRASRKIP